MKKNQKTAPKEKIHGIISVIQATENGTKKTENNYESSKKKKHGVISTIQAPTRKNA